MNPKVRASLSGWNSSVRSCRENPIRFYYSYLGYKVDTGEYEVVEYVKEHKQEIMPFIADMLEKDSVNHAKFTPRKLAKAKPKLAAERRASVLMEQLDQQMNESIARD